VATASYTIQNLIQGISQQSAEQRRPTQCEAQQDCLNSPKEGAVARPSFEWHQTIDGVNFTDAAFYEVWRGLEEHYLVVIPNSVASGNVRVFDLVNNAECTVTKDGSQTAYLATGSSSVYAKDIIEFQTVDDYTFVVNKTKTIAMTGAVQSTRPPEALIFVKAGAYKQKYAVSVSYGGNRYIWTYLTPDNSAAGNAEFIGTSAITNALFFSLTGGTGPHNIPGAGEADTGNYLGVQGLTPTPAEPGTYGPAGRIDIRTLGFSVEVRGNVIRIWRGSDSNPFKIDASDGAGNNFISAIKDTVQSLDKLPDIAMVDFRVRVIGADTQTRNDYWVAFTATNTWEEVIGAGTHTTLDNTTMPHALINTGFQTFTWAVVDWDTRVVGDDETSPLPYFVGKSLQDIFFHHGRLGLLSEAAYDLSKTRNSFSFFPDTVQAVLATAPISNPLSSNRSIALMRQAVTIDESQWFWAQLAQFRLSSGQEPLRPDTAEAKVATSYTFADKVRPYNIGTDLYFISEPNQWAQLKVLSFSNGKAAPVVTLTDHVPSLIPKGCRAVSAAEDLRMIFVQTDGWQKGLYVYSFLTQANNQVQSAWQLWNLPAGTGTVLWASASQGFLYVGLQRNNEFVIVALDLSNPDDTGEDYHTRLDLRVGSDSPFISASYSSTTELTTITLPFKYDTATEQPYVVIKTTAGDYIRGQILTGGRPNDTHVTVQGNITAAAWYVGFKITSAIRLSEFFPRDQNGEAKMFDEVVVRRMMVSHKKTSYYQAVVDTAGMDPVIHEYTSRMIGTAVGASGELKPVEGKFDFAVGKKAEEHALILQNDTPFPSAWQRVKVTYSYVDRGARDLTA
jgi:hypothetical protein